MSKTTMQAVYGDFDNHHYPVITDPALPRMRCDEALPLGNGIMGVLVWMQNNNLLLSLDRGDLWDERRPSAEQDDRYNWQGMCKLIQAADLPTLRKLFSKNSDEPYPTRLPGGRVTLPLPEKDTVFKLDITTATATITHQNSWQLELFVPAEESALLRWKLTNGSPESMRIMMPAFESSDDINVRNLHYPEPIRQTLDNGQITAIENSDRSLGYAIAGAWQKSAGNTFEGAIVISKAGNIDDALIQSKKDLTAALQTSYDQAQLPHRAWWQKFYAHSSVKFADEQLNTAYQQARYFFGSNARKNRPPMALQGIWTIDNGTLPPWRGDYHNNLNTQFTYLSYLAANDLAGGREFLDFMFKLLPRHQELGRKFYGLKNGGAVIPGAMTQAGSFMPAAVHYTYHPDNGLWVAWMFYRHWRYTMDEDFLRCEAYPYAQSVISGALELAHLDSNGKFKFDWHASPEINDSEMAAFFDEMTSYVNCNMYALLQALEQMAGALNLPEDADFYRQQLQHCIEPDKMTAEYSYYLYKKTVLGIQCNTSSPNSHRHLVQLMGFYPYDLIDIERNAASRQLVSNTLSQLDFFGPGQWVGFSYPWQAMMENRMGNGAKAVRTMKTFFECFCSINGFHLNGDYKDLGASAYKYRPFTLETNFEAQEALHELLLHESCGILKFFPAAAALGNAEFTSLRAPGAFLISGRLEAGVIQALKIYSEAGKECTFANPYGQTLQITGSDGSSFTADGSVISFATQAEVKYTIARS
ncbi:MAG: hypothetical protein E7047_06040 [Lentisphaerae bacterium]|nr:hypothetical protein [Lentisphaerota bacterium]